MLLEGPDVPEVFNTVLSAMAFDPGVRARVRQAVQRILLAEALGGQCHGKGAPLLGLVLDRPNLGSSVLTRIVRDHADCGAAKSLRFAQPRVCRTA